jgi:hypothetical protein
MLDNVRLMVEWAPLLGYARRLSAAGNNAERADAIADAIEWLASKTGNRMDDELARRVAAVLKTTEGAALAGWIADKAAELEKT